MVISETDANAAFVIASPQSDADRKSCAMNAATAAVDTSSIADYVRNSVFDAIFLKSPPIAASIGKKLTPPTNMKNVVAQ